MKRASALGMIFAVGCVFSAEATPFTYQFDMPNWEFNSSPSLFGTSALFDVTVDNGSSSSIGQSYSLTNITGFTVSAVGAASSFSGVGGGVMGANDTFLTTDLLGTPTLDLRSQASSGAYTFGTLAEHFQMGVLTPPGGFVPFLWNIGPDGASVSGPGTCSHFCGFQVTGTLLTGTAVPEPTTLSVFGVGIAGALRLRRRKARA